MSEIPLRMADIMPLVTLETLSKLETENLFLQVTSLINDKSATDMENERLAEQQRLNLAHIESLNIQLRELLIENDTLRKERTVQETGENDQTGLA